jgi:acetamidase/formamidase
MWIGIVKLDRIGVSSRSASNTIIQRDIDNDSAEDIRTVDLTEIHYLSGPFDIETAELEDFLLVEIQDVQPFQD